MDAELTERPMSDHKGNYRTRVTVLLAASCAVAAVLATSASGAPRASLSLRLVLPVNAAAYAPVYIAESRGFFEQAGVDVAITAGGINVLTALVSNQADITAVGVGGALVTIAQGKSTSVVYAFTGVGDGAAITVPVNSSAQSLSDLAGKRIGTVGSTGTSYGYARIYSRSLEAQGKKGFTIVPANSLAALVDGVASGQLDAAVADHSLFSAAVGAAKVKRLRDPALLPLVQQATGGQCVEGGFFGLSDTLKKKRPAVTRFLAAIDRATSFISRNRRGAVVTELQRADALNYYTRNDIIMAVNYNKGEKYWMPNAGFITPAMWANTLRLISSSEIAAIGDISASKYAYSAMVDMSYLQAARKFNAKQAADLAKKKKKKT